MLNWSVILVKTFCAAGIAAIGVITGAMAQQGAIVMPSTAVWLLAGLTGIGTGLVTLQSAITDAPTKKALTAIALVIGTTLLAGCAALRGPEGAYDGGFSCKGKGSLTGNGSLSIGAGYGGSGTNAWTIQGDCGDGFEITRHRERAKPAE